MIDLSINTDVAHQILTGFIKSEVTRVGFSRAVIGLSGGLDSALSCVLAVEALGRENVLAVSASAWNRWAKPGAARKCACITLMATARRSATCCAR